ncbi:TlpA disulfide reductase family protein [Sulfuricurvum sp.]|uniref:TlpA family protein disulfide reductase n=1 Tax=Sulfuricurvum sp. TaxID=2025608 RepID=UPI0019C48C9A|nr:TlpA disulfide reductase family protein [Sulfuricurvum sp.]MBD3798361.1 TlpA family protein disulfide reductase [Campylobacterota bacterium]MBD3805541.1 TlpA family protein disulfide reductase [Sulfuricurvum sp.]
MRFSTLLIPLVALSLIFHGCGGEESSEEAMVSTAEFTLMDTQGKSYTVEKRGTNFTLDVGEDKVVLFDIFATWCPPCQVEVKHLGNLQKKYGEDLIIMGITIEEDKSNAELESFREKYRGGEYLISNKADNQKLARSIASTIGVGQQFPIPLMVLYKNGEYVTHYAGATQEEIIDHDIAQVLGK